MIGDAMRNLEIPIGMVLSSPYCRCQDTAELAFGSSVVTRELRFGVGDDVLQTNQLSSSLKILVIDTANVGNQYGSGIAYGQPERGRRNLASTRRRGLCL